MILKQFATKRNDTVSQNITIKDAIDVMTKNGLRYLVFLEKQTPCGIITERDILRFMQKGISFDKDIKDVYTSKLIKANGERTIEYALSLMVDYSIRRLIVIDDENNYLGTIEQEEIVHQLETENFNKKIRLYEVMQMASEAISLPCNAKLQEALDVMIEKKIGSILVGEAKKPVGILTESDVLKFANHLESKSISLEEVMQKPLVVVNVDDRVDEVLSLMKVKRIRRMVITDKDKRYFIISTRDVLNNLQGNYSKFLEKKLHVNRTMFDNLSELMFEVFDLDGTYVVGWANLKAKEVLNVNIDDNVEDILPKKLWSETVKAFKEGKKYIEEFIEIEGNVFRFHSSKSSVLKTSVIKIVLRDVNKIHRLNLEYNEKLDFYQNSMQEHMTLYEETFNQEAIGIGYIEKDGTIIRINPYLEQMLGYANEELKGKNIKDITHPEDRQDSVSMYHQLLHEKRNSIKLEKKYLKKDGGYIWGELTLSASKDENGKVDYLIGFVQNITKRRRALNALEKQYKRQRLAQSVFDHTAEGIVITDKNKKITAINPAFTTITGYDFEEIEGKNPSFLASRIHKKTFFTQMWKEIKQSGKWTGELWNCRKNGETYPQLLTISKVVDEDDRVMNYIGVFSDITKMKETEQELEFMAHHDPLTKLPNRLLLEARLGHALEWAKRDEFQIAVLFIDLDHFKEINDTFGHSTGDAILTQVSKRFKGLVREKDTIARIGGDEFIVVIENFGSMIHLEALIERIIEVFKKPFFVKSRHFSITCSIGSAIYPENGNTIESLIKNADAAMYKAKAEGRNKNHFYTDKLTENLYEKMTMLAELRRAVEMGQITLHYQPQIDMKTKECVGIEALARWIHEERGFISPEVFISLAEESGLIIELGKQLLQKACKNIKRWQDLGLCGKDWRMAVNISAIQILRSDFYTMIKEVIVESGINPSFLELELTESYVMKNPKKTIEIFNKLKSLGVTISMDDFGTGYSSLSYLKQFPLDRVKIDRSFIMDIPQDSDDVAITKAIIALSSALGLEIVGEGVENEAQEEFLLNEGCHIAQGYKYLKPVCEEEIEMFLLENS